MENKKIIDQLILCAAQCANCYDLSAQERDTEMLHRCMMLTKDCREICLLTARLLERYSPGSHKLLKLCSEVCMDCARECDRHHHDHCRKCAETCRQCAQVYLEHEQYV